MNKSVLILLAALVLTITASSAVAQETPEFTLPEFTKTTLENGMTVYLMERHAVPLIYVDIVLDAGSVYDGRNFGLANLTADALMFGAGEMSKSEIEETADFYGANLGSGGGSEGASVSASFAVEDVDVFFPIIRDVVLNPRFDAEEFKKHLALTTMRLQRAKESPNAVIGSYFNKFIYGDHPYANPVGGTIPTLSKMTIESVKEFYRAYYRPENAAVILVGDFKTDEMLEKIKETFGGWQGDGEAPTTVDLKTNTEPFAKDRVLIIDKSDSMQTTFFIGSKGVAMSNPDYVAIELINTILGGRFTSWLNSELRIKSGLTYGARSNWDMRKHGGAFSAASFTANPTTEKAMELAMAVFDRLHKDGIDAETLQSGKNYMKGNFPRQYESPGQLMNLLETMHVYGLEPGFINDFSAKLDAVTPEKVKEVISKYYPKENFQIVMAGQAELIKDIAAKYGEVTVVPIESDDYLSK